MIAWPTLFDLVILWRPMPVVRLILPFAILTSAQTSLQQVILIVGNPKILAKIQLTQLVLLALIIWPVLHYWEIAGMAGAVSVITVAGTVAFLIALKKYADFSIARALLWPMIGSLVGALVLLSGSALLDLEEYSSVLRLTFKFVFYLAGFLFATLVFDRRFAGDILTRFRDAGRPIKS